MRLNWPEILVILAVVLLLFGGRKLPELARSLGASAKEFQKGMEKGSEEGVDGDVKEENTEG